MFLRWRCSFRQRRLFDFEEDPPLADSWLERLPVRPAKADQQISFFGKKSLLGR